MPRDYLFTDEVCELYGLTPAILRGMRQRGEIAPIRPRRGQRLRWRLRDLEAWHRPQAKPAYQPLVEDEVGLRPVDKLTFLRK